MLVQMWPSINTYAQTLIKTTVEPKLQETLVNYKITGFQFVKLRFGTIVSIMLSIQFKNKFLDIDCFIREL